MTIPDYENYIDGFEPLYYDSLEQLIEYEGEVEYLEVNLFDINLN